MEKEEVKTTAEAAPQENEATAQAAAPAEATQEGAVPAEPKAIDSFREYMHANFPDSNYDEDEDAIYRDAKSRFDALEGDSKTLKNLTEKLNSRLGKNPAEAEAVLDWLDGVDIRVAIARHMGSDALSVPEEGSEEYENFRKAGEAKQKEIDDTRAHLDEYRANAEQSEADLKAFAEENGLDAEQTAELEKYISDELLPAIYSGKLSKDFYKSVMRARNYDADIEGAREQGRVDGRNEKIEVEKKRHAGSGLPNGGAGGNASDDIEAPKSENKTVDFLAKMAKRRV